MDKTIVVIILIIVVVAGGFLFWQYKPAPQVPVTPTTLPAGIVFFYGDTCSHCKKVEDFVSQNNIQDKVKFTSLEVYNNRANAQLLIDTEVFCKIKANEIGSIPMLWDGSKCFLGDLDIIDFFKKQASIQ